MLGDTGDKGLVAAKMSGEYETPVLSGCQRVIWGLGGFLVKVSESIEEQCQHGDWNAGFRLYWNGSENLETTHLTEPPLSTEITPSTCYDVLAQLSLRSQ